MPNTLVFPDSVRLAHEDELPGPADAREAAWSSIQSSSIHAGYVLYDSGDERFRFYAEANVHATDLWVTFRDLCEALLSSEVNLILGGTDEEPRQLGSTQLEIVLSALGSHSYELAHNGHVHFGLVSEQAETLNEVFVAPTKHLKVWLNDRTRFLSVMESHNIPAVKKLEFLDNYPRVTTIMQGKHTYADELAIKLMSDINVRDHE